MTQNNPEKIVKFWLDKSNEDLISAKVMLDSARYSWCAFICQQALEKCLKAGYVKKKNQIPPYIHKLERLCEVLELSPPVVILDSIIKIDKYYIVSRYPTYRKEVEISDKKIAEEVYKHTKEIYKWLIKQLDLE